MVEDVPHLVGHRRDDAVCTLARIVLLVGLTMPLSVSAQPAPLETPAPVETPAPLDNQLVESQQLADSQIESQRAIILNLEDSLETRISQAVTMLSLATKPAIDSAVNLLSTGNEPSTKVVMCRAIQKLAQDSATEPNGRLVDPLLATLDHPSEDVLDAASLALSQFKRPAVFDSLRQIAGQQDATLSKRGAALTALSRNTDRRDVVARLIQLLDTTDDEFRPLVLRSLASVASSHGGSIEAWKAWWKVQEALSESEWLRSQLHLKSKRLDAREGELRKVRESALTERDQLASRLSEALTAQYRLTSPDAKNGLILAWLGDATPTTRLVAAGLVAEQISEGNLPAEEIRQALRKGYNDASPAVRKTSVEIVGALNDPEDAAPMLARLKDESDPGVRETILSMLGKLRNPIAVIPLIDEITDASAPESCVAAAAESLSTLANRDVLDASHLASSIEPLRSRYARVNGSSNRLKVALLKAMAAIGSAEFKPEFEANLGATDPELLLQAIRGVAIVGYDGRLDRLSELAAHTDARVRQKAIAALGALGTLAELDTVAARLNPGVEKVDGPRQQAWLAFGTIASRSSLNERVELATRLGDYPNLLAEYLTDLESDLTKAEPPHPMLSEIQGQLAETYVGLGRNVEALPYWRKYYESSADRDESERIAIAFQLLKCSLACDKTEGLPELFATLSKAPANMVESVQHETLQYLEHLASAQRVDELRALSTLLHDMPLAPYPLLRTYLESLAIPDATTNGVQPDGSNGKP
jgi:HEAT repeat protein